MKWVLNGQENFVHEWNPPSKTLEWSYYQMMKSPHHVTVDIALIRPAPFERYMKNKNMEVFITSLYKIDWTIEDK